MKSTFRIINRVVADGVIEKYAVGGAVAALNYIEPTLTDDVCGVEVGRFMFRVGKEPEAEALAKAGTLPIVFNGAADGRSRLGRRGGLSRPRSCRLDRTRLAFFGALPPR